MTPDKRNALYERLPRWAALLQEDEDYVSCSADLRAAIAAIRELDAELDEALRAFVRIFNASPPDTAREEGADNA